MIVPGREGAAMVYARPFEVLFLTDFSDACYRAIPAVAQLGDELDLRLTLVHAHGHAGSDQGQLEPKFRGFFPDADHYASCRRMLVPGTAIDAVRQLRADRPVDLIVAPAGDRSRLPRPGHTSLRGRLVRESLGPVFTFGGGALAGRLVRPTRRVAVCLDLFGNGRTHLRLAAEYARGLEATLHVIQILPDIDDGSIASLAYAEPFDSEHVTRQLRRAGAGYAGTPAVDVVDRAGLAGLLLAHDIDLVFLDGNTWMRGRWFGNGLRRVVDALPCPSICVDATRDDLPWHLPRNPARAVRAAVSMALPPIGTGEPVVAH